MKGLLSIIVLLAAATISNAQDHIPAHPYIKIETTEGVILLELDGRRAPLTVLHFLESVDSGYYDGTIFHRVLPDFMIQGGGYLPNMELKEPDGGVVNESGNGLENVRGTIALAQTAVPHSGNKQFFINVGDNMHLNPRPESWGFAVFGFVIDGMDVVDKISVMRTGPAGKIASDVPVVPVVIKKMSRYEFE